MSPVLSAFPNTLKYFVAYHQIRLQILFLFTKIINML